MKIVCANSKVVGFNAQALGKIARLNAQLWVKLLGLTLRL